MRRTPLRRSVERAKSIAMDTKSMSMDTGHDHASTLISRLRARFPLPRWGLVTEVRNHAGPDAPDVLRRADAIAEDLYAPLHRKFVGFEVKTSRADFLRELRDPAKSSPFQLHCAAWWLVVPCPWKRVVLSTSLELPDRWGLLEVGTGNPVVVVEALEREAEPPTLGFSRALFLSALVRGEQTEGRGVEAPLSRITRWVSRSQVGLICGHVAPAPLTKRALAVPCFSCAAGLPGDRGIVKAAIEQATPEERREFRALLDELDGPPPCGCRDRDPVYCAYGRLATKGLPFTVEDCAAASLEHPCRCPCHERGGAG